MKTGYLVAKRLMDLGVSSLGLVLLSPVLMVIAAAVKAADRGPVLFRHQRVGRDGRLFGMWKFRTMVPGADKMGPGVTRGGDARITRLGRWLRKTKLDELPQLWNVLTGDMTLVGPRPEVPQYVERYTPEQRAVLALTPGLTDRASLEFVDEEELLRSAKNLEQFYMEHCVPRKIELNLEHWRKASLWEDIKVLFSTATLWFRSRGKVNPLVPAAAGQNLMRGSSGSPGS